MSDTDAQPESRDESTEITLLRELVDLQERHIERLHGIKSSLRGLNLVGFFILLGLIVLFFRLDALGSQMGRMRVY